MGRMILTVAIVGLFLFGLLFSWARIQEKSALFFPSKGLHTTPADAGLNYEDAFFKSGKDRLHGWFIQGSGRETVLWLHGNAGNIADRLDQAKVMNERLGVSSFLVDYRGYGNSEGEPSEKGLYEDAAAAYRWLIGNKGVKQASIVLYGHSLGTAVAVDLALGEGKGSGGLVLESPFTNARDMARMVYNGFPVDLLMSVKLDNIGRVGSVSMPVLVIHGVADATIPFAMGKKVFDAASQPKAFLPVAGADHSDCYIVGAGKYWGAWETLLREAQRPTSNVQR
jgi:fermentation-respiration switch protein FrsA (DUF1100 family)